MTNHPTKVAIPTSPHQLLYIQQIAAWQLPGVVPIDNKPLWVGALPSLQRGSVWGAGRIELFWDSLFRGFPVGSLVVSEKLESQRSSFGRLGGTLDPWPGMEKRHILDGQQRANAIALGFYDPFAASEPIADENILWIDLDTRPESLASGSTRQFLFRLTTPAHPWGYAKGDNAGRLETWKMGKSSFLVSRKDELDRRPLPRELCPFDSQFPVPLAWLLLPLSNGLSGADLWSHIRSRCMATRSPWAEVVATHLAEPNNLQLLEIEAAAKRALVVAIPILEVPQDAILAPTRNEDKAGQNISNIEHLFQRLNNGGAPISADDLRYSMIKAYWPGIEQTIECIKPLPMLASRLALLGARAGHIKPDWIPESFPRDLSVAELRAIATAPEKHDERNQLRQYFGLPDEISATTNGAAPIIDVIKIVERWLLFRGADDIGLPHALRTRIAQDSPEVYLLLMILARLALSKGPESAEEIRRQILGMATALHWFSRDKGRAVKRIYGRLRAAGKLDASLFKGCLSSAKNEEGEDSGIHDIIDPETAARYLSPEGELQGWSFWNRIVVLLSEGDEKRRPLLEHNVWPVVSRIIWEKELLLFAQRQWVAKRFKSYDNADATMWDEHNRPWDYDHLLAQTTFHDLRRTGSGEPLYRETCREWGGTIGNFHILPFEENRSRQAMHANMAFSDDKDLGLKIIRNREELDAFSVTREDVRENEAAVRCFVRAASRRINAIYKDWFDSLDLKTLLS